jgi:hypothetical protein
MSQTIARRTGWSVAVAATLWSASAWSVGYLTPASACRGEDEFNVRFTRQNGKFRNGSGTNDLMVDCPVPVDRQELKDVAALSIVVGAGVVPNDCIVVDRPYDGSSGESYTYDYSNPQGSQTQIVWTSSGGTGQMPVTMSSNHTLTIVCEVDHDETLYNFHLDYEPE